ncbi:hypothetical protein D3C78_1283620 [compost metagenome]
METLQNPGCLAHGIVSGGPGNGLRLGHLYSGIATVTALGTFGPRLPGFLGIIPWRYQGTEAEHVEVDGLDMGPMVQPEPGGHYGAPVAALGAVAGVAKHFGHQFVPERGGLALGRDPARFATETEARQAGNHQVVRILGLATMARGIGQRLD